MDNSTSNETVEVAIGGVTGEMIIEEEITDNEASEQEELFPEVQDEDVGSSSLTGNVVGNMSTIINKSKYYVLGIIVIAIIIVALMLGFRNNSFRELQKAAMHSDDRPPTILTDKLLEDAEKRFSEAQRELNDVKTRYTKRISAQEKLREAQKELSEAEASFSDAKQDVSDAKQNREGFSLNL